MCLPAINCFSIPTSPTNHPATESSNHSQHIINNLDNAKDRTNRFAQNLNVCYWIQSKGEDRAFCGKNAKKEREEHLKNKFDQKKTRVYYKTNDFFRYMYDLKKENEKKIDLLVIAGHGTSTTLGRLKVIKGKEIRVFHSNLLKESNQKAIFAHYLEPVLNHPSIVVLDACSTASSSEKEGPNIAQVISQLFPHSYIFASQHKTVHEPDINFGSFEGKQYVDVTFFMKEEKKNALMSSKTKTKKAIIRKPAVVYHKGREIVHSRGRIYLAA